MPDNPQPGEAVTGRAAAAWTALLAAFAILAAFAPTLGFSFLAWDDYKLLHGNLNIQGFSWEHLRWMFTTFHMGPYQPLSWLSYALDHSLWGDNPAGYHLVNNLLHAANAALVCLLALELTDRVRREDAELPRLAGALLAALLFALHPLRVESVAWVTERRDVLSGFFYLLCLLFYVKADAGEKRNKLLACALFAYLLSLLAKAAAFSLPVILLLLDIYPLRRRQSLALWLEKLPFFVLALAATALAYAGQVAAGTLIPLKLFGPFNRAIEMFWGMGFYPLKTLWPSGLSPLYETGPDLNAYLPAAALSAISLSAVTVGLWLARRRFPAGLAAWAYYLITILPVSGLLSFGVQLAADRYSYLSCLGFALLGGAALRWTLSSGSRIASRAGWASAVAAVALLAFLTARQLPVWQNTESLWIRVLALDPDSLVARNNLGEELARQGRLSEAEGQFRAALVLNPLLPMTLNNLANALADEGKRDEALDDFHAALRSDPQHIPTLINLCRLLSQMGRTQQAAAACGRALELKPGFAPAESLLRSMKGAHDAI